MSTVRYIEKLLKKYRQAPSFPFDDWCVNPVSAYALTNLWDDLFRVAAGEMSGSFVAAVDMPLDEDSHIYDVIRKDRRKRFNVRPQAEGGDFGLLVGWQNDTLPDRTELCFTTDLQPARLAAAFDMTREWLLHDIERSEIEKGFALNDAFVGRYADVFTFPQDDED